MCIHITKEELQTAVDLWVDDSVSALETYDEINNWNVSFITDMSSLFYEKASFNNYINNWDVSNVTNMHRMFRGASSFNQSLNSWDVSSVTDMSNMQNAESYNQDISSWDVSSVTNMQMFYVYKLYWRFVTLGCFQCN